MLTTISAIASSVAAIAAIFSPIAVSVINNKYQLKLQKTNFKINRLTEISETFLKLASEQIHTHSNSVEFYKISGVLFLYLPIEYHQQLEEFINSIKNNTDDVQLKYFEISKMLSEFLSNDTLKTSAK